MTVEPTGSRRNPWPVAVPSGLLWVAGAVVIAVVAMVPAYLGWRAFSGGSAAWEALLRSSTLATLGRTAVLATGVTASAIVISVPLAWLTTRSDLPGRRVWTILVTLPLVIPSYVGAYLFASAFGPRGLLQQLLEPLGVERLPSIYGFPGALLAVTAATYPYVFLAVRAAWLRLDPSLEHASRTLGQGPLATFRRITVPQLRPALAAGGLLAALYAVRDFGAVTIMRYDTFSPVIYVQYQSAFDRTSAAVLALLVAILAIGLVTAERRLRPRARYHGAGARPMARPSRVELGRYRWPALAFVATIVLIALVVPVGILCHWLIRGLLAGETLSAIELATSAVHSAVVAGIAAGVTVVAALPLAIISIRRPGRLARMFESVAFLGFALPGVAVALAFVFFGIRIARPLYQTLPMLIVAYGVLFLPLAQGNLQSALAQVHPHLEQSARTLGRGVVGTFRTVTLPLMAPGVGAGLVLVFLSAMKELPVTLILGPTTLDPLALTLWSEIGEAFFARAAAPALLLILLSSLPAALLTLRRDRIEVPATPSPTGRAAR